MTTPCQRWREQRASYRPAGETIDPRRLCPTCGHPLQHDWFACTGPETHHQPFPKPVLYASRTGTVRNLEAMAVAGIRLLATPQQLHRYRDPVPPWAYMLDNGAFGAGGFDPAAFTKALHLLGQRADQIVLPDIVCGGHRSLLLSLAWLDLALRVGPRVLIPVQDGMEESDLRPHLRHAQSQVGIFVGGSTAWKEATMARWGRLAEEEACWMHVGRVNTPRRMALAVAAGAHSVDGSTATRFACRASYIATAARQGDLLRIAS